MVLQKMQVLLSMKPCRLSSRLIFNDAGLIALYVFTIFCSVSDIEIMAALLIAAACVVVDNSINVKNIRILFFISLPKCGQYLAQN